MLIAANNEQHVTQFSLNLTMALWRQNLLEKNDWLSCSSQGHMRHTFECVGGTDEETGLNECQESSTARIKIITRLDNCKQNIYRGRNNNSEEIFKENNEKINKKITACWKCREILSAIFVERSSPLTLLLLLHENGRLPTKRVEPSRYQIKK